ncbi:MAG: ATP-binding protein [Holophagales bacterium]|nr:ATP-binding protein [Holophagales bacterium]
MLVRMQDLGNRQDLGNKLVWLMAIRVLVVASILLPNLLTVSADGGDPGVVRLMEALVELVFDTQLDDGSEGPPPPRRPRNEIFQVLVAGVSIQTLIYAALLRLMKSYSVGHAYLQLVGDVLLVTLLIYKFGHSTANLSILYFVIIGVACFLARRRSGIAIASLASVLYVTVVLLHQDPSFRQLWAEGNAFGPLETDRTTTGEPASETWLESTIRWLEPPAAEDVSGVPVAYNLGINLLGFYAVALFGAYLARDRALERQLQQRSLDLAYLKVLYRDVIQSISSGLAVTDLDGIMTRLNHSGEEILGVREQDLEGRHISETGLFDAPSWARITERAGNGMVRDEVELDRRGEPLLIGFSLTYLRDGEGNHRGYILIFQDLTEWRRLQEQVRIQDRMAAIGQMAAGLAHEVGNPLAAISGSVQMLSQMADSGSQQARLADITLKESRRLDRTVKTFLQFARPRGRHLESFDIGALLTEDVHLLRNSSEVLLEHQITLDAEPATLTADLDQVGQLFWNLARNALQAMPEGGRLHIEGRTVGDGYQIRFQDSGHGMTEEERANLFQPFKSFFDSGTGLGMAIVYRIVEEHGGNIEVDSRPGAGTSITVELPLQPIGDDPESGAEIAVGTTRVESEAVGR